MVPLQLNKMWLTITVPCRATSIVWAQVVVHEMVNFQPGGTVLLAMVQVIGQFLALVGGVAKTSFVPVCEQGQEVGQICIR